MDSEEEEKEDRRQHRERRATDVRPWDKPALGERIRQVVVPDRGDLPNSLTLPPLGSRSPRIILIVVDFPEPFGPRSPNTSPPRTSSDSPSTAATVGLSQKSRKVLRTSLSSITASVMRHPVR